MAGTVILRPKEERKARTIILPVRVIRRLEELSEMTGATQSDLVTQALEQFLPNVRVEPLTGLNPAQEG